MYGCSDTGSEKARLHAEVFLRDGVIPVQASDVEGLNVVVGMRGLDVVEEEAHGERDLLSVHGKTLSFYRLGLLVLRTVVFTFAG